MHFLFDSCLQRGSAASKATWWNYGYTLLDFWRYLTEADRHWNEPRKIGVPSVLAGYRTWARKVRNLEVVTINLRLDILVRFFSYAQSRNLVETLPFAFERRLGPLREWIEAASSRAPVLVADVKFRSQRKGIQVLSFSQASELVKRIENKTHRLMVELALGSGMRVGELVTFPARMVVDPRVSSKEKLLFAVTLSPNEVCTKGGIERDVHISRGLMEKLWAYKVLERRLRERTGEAALLLTEQGTRYTTRVVWKLFTKFGQKIGVKSNPHVLRHTYATHTLARLSQSRNIGSALLYVRDRLGHSSIRTTEIYLHYVDQVAERALGEYHLELHEDLSDLSVIR